MLKVNFHNLFKYALRGFPFAVKTNSWVDLYTPSFPWFYTIVSGGFLILPQFYLSLLLESGVKGQLHFNRVLLSLLLILSIGMMAMIIYNFLLFSWQNLILKLGSGISIAGMRKVFYLSTVFQFVVVILFSLSYLCSFLFENDFLSKVLGALILMFAVLRILSLYVCSHRECKKILSSTFVAILCPDAWLAMYAAYGLMSLN